MSIDTDTVTGIDTRTDTGTRRQLNQSLTPPALRESIGARSTTDPAQCAAFNAGRCKWVNMRSRRTETVNGGGPQETVVGRLGTRYGEWSDSRPLKRRLCVDRPMLRRGRRAPRDAWNGSADRRIDPRTGG